MNIGIIGFGLMGQVRARNLALMPEHRLVAVYDPDQDRAKVLATQMEYSVESSYEALVQRKDIDVVLVAVPHFRARDIVVVALQAGKHVLCEKPLGLNTQESGDILKAARDSGRHLTVGFNYRFYPGIQEARRIIAVGGIGQPTHLRCVVGHGGRPGMEREWKTSKALCGGGVLLDPGIHVIDLIRFLFGEIRSGVAWLSRTFWEIDVEDNAFLILETVGECLAQVHTSITEWKNKFALDIFGRDGYVSVQGRSDFYGPQVVRHGKRWGWLQNPPGEEVVEEYTLEDTSFALEMRAFLNRIAGKEVSDLATGGDGRRALEIIERLYRAGNGQVVTV